MKISLYVLKNSSHQVKLIGGGLGETDVEWGYVEREV